MKKILPLLLFMLTTACAFSQHGLAFCASVDANGYCFFNNNKFIAAQDSTNARIFMQVGGNVALGTSKLTYKIFALDSSSGEQQVASIDQQIQPEWMIAWRPYSFVAGKKYMVKIYNNEGVLICNKQFELLTW